MSNEQSASVKKTNAKKNRSFLFLMLFIVVILGVSGYLLLENYFVVKEVSIMKSEIYEAKDVSVCADIKNGTPLYKLDRQKIIEKVQKNFPYLEDVKVTLKFPHKVQIIFREEYGKYSIALGLELFALDDEMFVLAKETEKTDIPRVEIVSGDVNRCIVGESLTFIDEDTAPILKSLVKGLNERKMIDSVKKIDVINQFDIHLDYEGRFDVAMGDHLDIPLKLAMVEKIIEDLGEGAAGEIDISDSDQAYVKLINNIA